MKTVASRHNSQKFDHTGLSDPASAWNGLKVGSPRAPLSQASVTSTTRPYKTSNLLISTGKSTGICVKIGFRPICLRLALVPSLGHAAAGFRSLPVDHICAGHSSFAHGSRFSCGWLALNENRCLTSQEPKIRPYGSQRPNQRMGRT